MIVAALFVQPGGVYAGRPDVDPWPADRDARAYPGPWPVVAHPPCASWGAYSRPIPASRARGPLRGEDDGCFAAAVEAVRRWGGVLEHPRWSWAWSRYGLPEPVADGGWRGRIGAQGWACEVEQGHYGHVARKPTWLYVVAPAEPPPLRWGAADVAPIGTGRRAGNVESMSVRARAATPQGFADLLIELAQGASLRVAA